MIPNTTDQSICLVIDKSSCRMRLKSFVNEDLRGNKYGVFGILGIINIRKDNFLAIVTDREQVGQIR